MTNIRAIMAVVSLTVIDVALLAANARADQCSQAKTWEQCVYPACVRHDFAGPGWCTERSSPHLTSIAPKSVSSGPSLITKSPQPLPVSPSRGPAARAGGVANAMKGIISSMPTGSPGGRSNERASSATASPGWQSEDFAPPDGGGTPNRILPIADALKDIPDDNPFMTGHK